MSADPARRGTALAGFHRDVAPRLWREIEAMGVLPAPADDRARARAAREWECFALYACVRGLVAALGFNRETAAAIDALHDAVLATWRAAPGADAAALGARVAERYAEYGAIGQAGGAAGAATVTARLGAACARHVAGDDASPDLAALLGDLHESVASGAADHVRQTG